MANIRVTCEVKDYSGDEKQSIKVRNHWTANRYVVLEVEGKRYTVSGNDLKTAVDNCMNVGF